MHSIQTFSLSTAIALTLALPLQALAQTSTGTAAAAAPAEYPAEQKPAAAKPQPYMLPFQLRGAAVGKAARFETAIASFDLPAGETPTLAGFLSGSYNFTPELGVFARIGIANGGAAERGTILSNPAIGGVYLLKLPSNLRLASYLAFTIPIGGGGGDMPDATSAAARTFAVPARSAMDNAMFGVNDLGIAPGVDFAWVQDGFTAQIEATAIFAFRVRGSMAQPDESKVNLTAGAFAGYFFAPWISAGAELRFQRWLSPPKAVDTAMNRDALISQLSFAVGPRFHFQIGDSMWFRPAIAYARGIDEPMTTASYNIIFLDLPVAF